MVAYMVVGEMMEEVMMMMMIVVKLVLSSVGHTNLYVNLLAISLDEEEHVQPAVIAKRWW